MAVAGIVLGELLIHGRDAAAATGSRWSMPADETTAVWEASLGLIGAWLDPETAGHHATCELRVRGAPRTRVTIDDGTIVTDPAARPDCMIAEDPATMVRIVCGERLAPCNARRKSLASRCLELQVSEPERG